MLFSGIKNFDGGVVDTEFQKMTYGCECGQAKLEIVSDGTAYPCIGLFQTDLYLWKRF